MPSINSFRGRLYLLGRFPHKDGSPGRKQGRIALRLDDTSANQRIAKRLLKTLEKQLNDQSFCWVDWAVESRTYRWRDAIDALYKKKVINGHTSQSTWEVSYMGLLRQINCNQEVTTTTLEKALTKYRREQYSYKLLWYLCKDIALLSGCPLPDVGDPLYSKAKKVDVPTDDEIVEWVLNAGQPHQWAWGMMATYGLRPHEVGVSTMIEGDQVSVPDETKTGHRLVLPVPRDWVDLFDLRNRQEIPASNVQENRRDADSQWLNRRRLVMGIPYRSYALRHGFAARLWKLGGGELDIYTAARLMGHSSREHELTYRQHIAPHTVIRAAQEALDRNQQKVADQLERSLSPSG